MRGHDRAAGTLRQRLTGGVDRGRRHLVVRGRVQGVNFRWSCREVADRLDLSGWVRNRPDGSVTDVEEHVEAAWGEVGFEIRR